MSSEKDGVKTFRLRRSVPLKTFAHITMFLCFVFIVVAVVWGIVSVEVYYGSGYADANVSELYNNWQMYVGEYADLLTVLNMDIHQFVYFAVFLFIVFIAAIFIYIICLVYTIVAAGWTNHYEDVHIYWFDKIYTEIAAAIYVGIWIVTLVVGFNMLDCIFGSMDLGYALLMFGTLMGCYIFVMIGLYSIARRAKAHNLIKQSLIYKFFHGIYKVIYQGFINNNLLRKYISVVLGLGVLDLILLLILLRADSLWTIVVIIFILVCEFIYVGRKLVAIQEIARGARKIASGHLDYKINTNGMGSGVFLEFANNINNIGMGLNRAVDESIKSERMKADLITNVSHDIKTPLTSIINYVDLLKRQNITEEPSREYIDILESKSQRLKMLIEDLVEASRASTGNIVLECAPIDFYELVQQVAGTFDEKYAQRQLTLVLTPPEETLMVYADGRRMFRVLDNLFNNACKYAMEGSRVYVDMYYDQKMVYYVMKNISQAPLNISAEELTQRFVRGDESRSTEGSGLGLSIAQSLVELHGGIFSVYLDGDLFKVTVSVPRIYPEYWQ